MKINLKKIRGFEIIEEKNFNSIKELKLSDKIINQIRKLDWIMNEQYIHIWWRYDKKFLHIQY